jgi:hypothetical protein
LTTLYLVGAKNIYSWRARKADLQHTFPLDIPIVFSYALVVSTNGEHLTCGGFSHSEIVHLGSFEFIADYFVGLSLSPKRSDSGVAFTGSTRSGSPSPWQAMVEDCHTQF